MEVMAQQHDAPEIYSSWFIQVLLYCNGLNVHMGPSMSLSLSSTFHQRWAKVEYMSPSLFITFPQFPCRVLLLHISMSSKPQLAYWCNAAMSRISYLG